MVPSPFPGMDPYLEDPELWSAVHAAIIARIQDQLAEALDPRYIVRFEERVYVIGEEDPAFRVIYPDVKVVVAGPPTGFNPPAGPAGTGLAIAEPIAVVEVTARQVERRVEIRDPTDQAVITVIEVLSPTSKTAGSQGRDDLLRKRREVYDSTTHWVEVDLLRGGTRTANRSPSADAEYQAYLSRHDVRRRRRLGYLWPLPLRERLSVIGIPLRAGEDDQPLDLQAILDHVYRRGGYGRQFRYAADPPPPAMPADALTWCRATTAAWRDRRPSAG